MTKQEALSKLHELHSQIQNLADDVNTAWMEAEPMSEDEKFLQEAQEVLSQLEADLSDFIYKDESEEKDEDLDEEEFEDELYTEMEDDPEEFFEKHMKSED